MVYQIAADMVLVLHIVFVLFAVLGSLLVFWRRYVIWLHLPAMIWAVWIEFRGGICPLTPLENWLRRQGDIVGYHGGFIEHYIEFLLYPTDLTRTTQVIMGAAVLSINCGLYGLLLFRIWRATRFV